VRTGETTLPKTLRDEELHRFESSFLNHVVCANDRHHHHHYRYRRRQVSLPSRIDEIKESLTIDREDALVEDETALKEAMLRE